MFLPKQSKTPALQRHSIALLFTADKSIFDKKSSKDSNLPNFSLASTIFCAAPSPTFFMARRPNLIFFPSTENSLCEYLISGGKVFIPNCLTSSIYSIILLSADLPISLFIHAVMYSSV